MQGKPRRKHIILDFWLSRVVIGIKKNLSVILGNAANGLSFFESQAKDYYSNGYKTVTPHGITATFVGMISSEISLYFGLQGLSTVLSAGCTSAIDAFGYCLNAIRSGQMDMAVTGGAESCISPLVVASFCRLGALSKRFNDSPETASRPFDKNRDGFVIGEGAWILVLEELEHAQKRGAKIYGEILGYGGTCDAYHRTSPILDGAELSRAMDMAIQDAKLSKDKIGYICAHGTATELNDSCETAAIKRSFGDTAKKIPVSSLKSIFGHPQGACGGCSVVASLLAMSENFVPQTLNYQTADPQCDLDYVPNHFREKETDYSLINSVAFGSKNSCLVVGKYT